MNNEELLIYGQVYFIFLIALPLLSVLFFLHHELEQQERRAIPSSFATEIWTLFEAWFVGFILTVLTIILGEIYSDYTGYDLFNLANQAVQDALDKILNS